MATSEFVPRAVPEQVSQEVQQYLDDMLNQISVLLNQAIPLIDDTTIAHTDEAETITAAWDFDATATFNVPAEIDVTGDSWALRLNRSGVFSGGLYVDSTSQYLLNNLGQTVFQNNLGSKDIHFGAAAFIQSTQSTARLTVGDGTEADGNVLVNLALDRAWQLRQASTGASTRLELYSTTNKIFDIGGDTLGSYVLRVNTAGSGIVSVADALTVGGEATFSATNFGVKIVSTTPKLWFDETDASADQSNWDIVASGSQLLFRAVNDAQTVFNAYMTATRSGATPSLSIGPSTLNINPSGNINITPGGTMQLLTGNNFRCFDENNTAYVDLATKNNSVSTGHNSWLDVSQGGKFRIQAVSIADDATATFDIGSSYAIVFVLTTYNSSTYAMLGFAGINAPLQMAVGSNVSTGAANPDVDTDVNIWPSSSGTMSIKNRMGSARSFYVFSLEP